MKKFVDRTKEATTISSAYVSEKASVVTGIFASKPDSVDPAW